MQKERSLLDTCLDEIRRVAQTQFEMKSDLARAYLGVLYKVPPKEQPTLFTAVITWHDALEKPHRRAKGRDAMSEKAWKRAAARLGDVVGSWTDAALIENLDAPSTAAKLWNRLQEYEGDDRTVALGLILDKTAIPYAPLPADIMTVKPPDAYKAALIRRVETVALIKRLFFQRYSKEQVAAALSQIFAPIADDDERAALFSVVLHMAPAFLLRSLFSRFVTFPFQGLPEHLVMIDDPEKARRLCRELGLPLPEGLADSDEDDEEEEDDD